MIVRRVVERDIPDVMSMAFDFWSESPHHRQLAYDAPKVARLLEAARVDPLWLALVARNDDDELVGMALMYAMPAFFSRDVEVCDLAFYVSKGRRGGRAAAGMIDAIATWSLDMDAKRVTIGVHTGINHDAAMRFFVKCGFHPSGIVLTKP